MDMDVTEPEGRTDSGPYIPDAGECIRCGMCVSSCPTFRLFQTDEETPRRRIRTISKILVEKLPITAEEKFHLDNCVQCRACEMVCPSKMAYGQLFDDAQAQISNKPIWLAKLAFWLIENKQWRSRLMPLLAAYLKSGLQQPLRRSGLLNKLRLADAESLIRTPALTPLAGFYPSSITKRGRVALFTGCIAEHFDRETLLAAIRLLNAIGFEVLLPPQQGCCGAIHQHNGQSAKDLINNNIKTFNALDVEAVLYTASGCGAMLSEYDRSDDDAGKRFSGRLSDVNDFLLKHWPDDLQLKSSNLKVAVHEPCSQRNVLKNQQVVYALLQKISGISIEALADNHICCGSGGSYMLTHPENTAHLKALKQQAIIAAHADVVVSSNFGCALFLADESIKVEHPLLLLSRQLYKAALN
ncbi:MAG: (Fe-S)-binding protein [Methyloglobulus sp.]|nr:(Fe-S)-binding protein [Methyloglobulus sp.]